MMRSYKPAVMSAFIMFIFFMFLPCANAAAGDEEPELIGPGGGGYAVMDVSALSDPYYAVGDGVKDSTAGINTAMSDLAALGGGTVYLPAGTYVISRPLIVPSFVTLLGDAADPDVPGDFGTVIYVNMPEGDPNGPGLIQIGGSAGVKGITVYYPHQHFNDMKTYPFTFYITGEGDTHMLHSITDCTLINSYNGIGSSISGATAHEQTTIENVRGTVLNIGYKAMNESDVGTTTGLTFTNSVWAEAGAKYEAPDRAALDAYTLSHTHGLVLGDLEWHQFYDVSVSDCLYGIHFIDGPRISFAGCFYGLSVKNCVYGIAADPDSLDSRWGVSISDSVIEGSTLAISNLSDGNIILGNTAVKGETEGKACAEFSYDGGVDITPVSHQAPAHYLYTVKADKTGASDAAGPIQAALDTASLSGGIVYLPAGRYRLNACLTVPPGVELRGCSSVATRNQSFNAGGTLLLSYYGYDEDDSPLITLGGDNAGLSGIKILYPDNNPQKKPLSSAYKKTSYAVKATGKGVYVENTEITAASGGIYMYRADGFVIKNLMGFCYDNMITSEGFAGGYIEGCLQNGNFISRIGLKLQNVSGYEDWPDEPELKSLLFDPISRKTSVFLRIVDSAGITGRDLFAYGVRTLIYQENSPNTRFINIGADNLGGSMLDINGGSFAALNTMRYNGRLYSTDSLSAVTLINSISIGGRSKRSDADRLPDEAADHEYLYDSYVRYLDTDEACKVLLPY